MRDEQHFCRTKKFDVQLSQALINERRLYEIFAEGVLEKLELKSETHQWEETGNICIEWRCRGELSGIAATEATGWVHELKRNGETLVYLVFPTERLKDLFRASWNAGLRRYGVGDNKQSDVVLIPLKEILQ